MMPVITTHELTVIGSATKNVNSGPGSAVRVASHLPDWCKSQPFPEYAEASAFRKAGGAGEVIVEDGDATVI
jgi:hypothetical protein